MFLTFRRCFARRVWPWTWKHYQFYASNQLTGSTWHVLGASEIWKEILPSYVISSSQHMWPRSDHCCTYVMSSCYSYLDLSIFYPHANEIALKVMDDLEQANWWQNSHFGDGEIAVCWTHVLALSRLLGAYTADLTSATTILDAFFCKNKMTELSEKSDNCVVLWMTPSSLTRPLILNISQ